MLDFSSVREKRVTLGELAGDLSRDDLRALSNGIIDTLLSHLAECRDADVIFLPVDPGASDANTPDGLVAKEAWTLAHVLAHTTAGAEEGAFLAAEMARGVPEHGRSRYEVPWETITTIAQCRQRLEESRRMRLASLDMWPDQSPDAITVSFPFLVGPINPAARFALGLMHEDGHVEQVADIVRQAQAARA